MKLLSVKYRITLGLVTILLSSILLVVFSGFGPDARQATMRGRKALCESIAINSSVLLSLQNYTRMEHTLAAIVDRNDDLLSAGVRRSDGRMVAQIGDHVTHWLTEADRSTETQVQVPLWSGESRWGTMELRFRPVTARGMSGVIRSPWTSHMALVGVMTFVLFSFYLRMVLRQLDPSKAIPKRVRSALDALAEGLLVTDKKGRVVLANEAFARWAGLSSEKLIGRDASGFPWTLPANVDAREGYPWLRALEERAPQAQFLLGLHHSDKHQMTLVANSSPVLGHDGVYRGVLTSFEDVTELEQNKVELSKAKCLADEANKAKSEFLARMSHEIRTPMNAILGYTEVLRRKMAESEQQREDYLLTIQNSGEHLLALINDILDLSKIESGRLELELARCSPSEVVSQVVSVLRIKAEERGLTLRYEQAGKLPETILTDAVRLRQVLINLIGNAIKFTETGGVRVVARMVQQPHTRLAIDVIDTGIGISEDALQKVFDPFSQADTTITRRFGGTGLGLAICHQLTEALGGEVTVQSELGNGSTFTINIDPGPLERVRLVDADETEHVTANRPRATQQRTSLPFARILVVDDAVENRRLVSLFLRAGADVALAGDGQVAVQLGSESEFDAILMDMQMPVMDGFTATKRLRELGCTTPIIALTANVMVDDERKCREAGCSGFLAKPISMDRLVESLNLVLNDTADSATRTSSPSMTQDARSSAASSYEEAECQSVHDTLTGMAHDAEAAATPIVSSLPMDDPEFREIVEGFVVRLKERVSEMRRVFATGDITELAELAHWLKGSGGSVGFDVFTVPAAELQSSAESDDREGILENLNTIEEITSRIQVPGDGPMQNAVVGTAMDSSETA